MKNGMQGKAEEEHFVGLEMEYEENCGRMRGRETAVDGV